MQIYVLETQGRTVVAGQVVEMAQGQIDNISARVGHAGWYLPTIARNEGQVAVKLTNVKDKGVKSELLFPAKKETPAPQVKRQETKGSK